MQEVPIIHIKSGSFKCNLDCLEALDTMTIPKFKKLVRLMTETNKSELRAAYLVFKEWVTASNDSAARKKNRIHHAGKLVALIGDENSET